MSNLEVSGKVLHKLRPVNGQTMQNTSYVPWFKKHGLFSILRDGHQSTNRLNNRDLHAHYEDSNDGIDDNKPYKPDTALTTAHLQLITYRFSSNFHPSTTTYLDLRAPPPHRWCSASSAHLRWSFYLGTCTRMARCMEVANKGSGDHSYGDCNLCLNMSWLFMMGTRTTSNRFDCRIVHCRVTNELIRKHGDNS